MNYRPTVQLSGPYPLAISYRKEMNQSWMEQILVPRSEAQKVKDTNFNIWVELSKLAQAPQKSAF